LISVSVFSAMKHPNDLEIATQNAKKSEKTATAPKKQTL
tara:strand:- start:1433 stop:1549 length:117 start_codon:yes stop_codon:yes gene_type:complete